MNDFDWLQIGLTLGAVTFLTPVLGGWMAKVFSGENTLSTRLTKPLEFAIYKLSGVNPAYEMNWKEYGRAVFAFNLLGIVVLFAIQVLQNILPLNPQNLPSVPWHLALNTAISFVTNTNWQAYSGENTLSYFTQMVGLTVQNFVSAATGIAVLLVLIRSLNRKATDRLGNFWVDMTRTVVHILLPLSVLLTIVFMSQGTIQNFNSAQEVKTIEGSTQVIPEGPAASQISIKQLGTNGGGFFNANSAHPYENPTPLTNFLSLIALILIPAALTFTFGTLVGSRRQGWAIFGAMMAILAMSLAIGLWSEYQTNPVMGEAMNMEGKETRFGVTNTVLWSTLTTAASNGSVNGMHSSLTPLAGGMAMLNIMLGEIVFGGVGCGLYGMLLFAILTVFLSGLMVGRTPEYLGKKIEAKDIQWTIVGILAPSAMILIGGGISAVLPVALPSLANKGPHGLSEILYALSSASGNNGSAFAGLNANTVYFNLLLGLAMLIGRFGVLFPVLAVAGNMVGKKISPPSVGTFTTDNWLFVVLLIGVIIIVGALTFFPALSLGPIVEHFLMLQGRSF
ncbi:MAG: potassium-transporting ATPase subunit KdpA [Bdellovibrionales bacterium]